MTTQASALSATAESEQENAVAAAEASIAALAENYIVWVRDDLTVARAAFVKAGEALPDNSEAVAEIFGISHNVKGQGGSFGFQLMTNIGASLCDYIRDGGPASDAKLKVIEAHLTALEFVIDREIKGDGGEALLDKLKGYIDNAA
ncbi:MAG: Hpt domain-containing protein [Pseudomonadota bacterium]|nr:Hpt domain-containing protein [Pseudomonadota bacterium]